jgi:hypothetical protein
MKTLGAGMGLGKVAAIIAVIIFAVAALGEWPAGLADDVEPVAAGLAFLAASFILS